MKASGCRPRASSLFLFKSSHSRLGAPRNAWAGISAISFSVRTRGSHFPGPSVPLPFATLPLPHGPEAAVTHSLKELALLTVPGQRGGGPTPGAVAWQPQWPRDQGVWPSHPCHGSGCREEGTPTCQVERRQAGVGQGRDVFHLDVATGDGRLGQEAGSRQGGHGLLHSARVCKPMAVPLPASRPFPPTTCGLRVAAVTLASGVIFLLTPASRAGLLGGAWRMRDEAPAWPHRNRGPPRGRGLPGAPWTCR